MKARAFALAAVIACVAAVAAEEAYALKASGTSTARYGSATAGIVCGDRLCSETAPPEPTAEPRPAQDLDPDLLELAPGVYGYFVQGYYSIVVYSGGEVLVTDPANEERAMMLKDAVATLTDSPVGWVAMSHEHYDHVGGAGVFEEAQVVCHDNCQPIFDLDPTGASPESVDVEFSDYQPIQVGDILVELHYLGPGDGDATTVVYLPEEQIVFTADMYETRSLTNKIFLDDSNSTGRQSILNTISEWPLRHAITTHSPETDPSILRENAQFLNDLRAAVVEAVANSEQEGFAAVVDTYLNPGAVELPEYSDWEGYDEYFERHVQRMVMSLYHGD